MVAGLDFLDGLKEVIDDQEINDRTDIVNAFLQFIVVVLDNKMPLLFFYEQIGSQPRSVQQIVAQHSYSHQHSRYQKTLFFTNLHKTTPLLIQLQPGNLRVEQKRKVYVTVVDCYQLQTLKKGFWDCRAVQFLSHQGQNFEDIVVGIVGGVSMDFL